MLFAYFIKLQLFYLNKQYKTPKLLLVFIELLYNEKNVNIMLSGLLKEDED